MEDNNVKSDNNFMKNIKSKYILKEIFSNLTKTKSLDIMRYNKAIQKCIGIDINTYINCYQQIEIEVIPHKMKLLYKKKKNHFIIYILMIIKKK